MQVFLPLSKPIHLLSNEFVRIIFTLLKQELLQVLGEGLDLHFYKL